MCVSVGQKSAGVRATIIRIVWFRAFISCCYKKGHIEDDIDLSVLFAVFRRYFALDCTLKMCVSLGLWFFFQEGCEIFVATA